MPTLTLTFQGTPLPSNFNGTLADFYEAMLANLYAEISSEFLLLGAIGGGEPSSDVGPWLNGRTWYVHDGTSYVPVTVKLGGNAFQITFAGTPTANRTVTFQDRTGTVALTSDIYVPRPTEILTGSGAFVGIDGRLSNSFYHKLTGDTSYAILANSVLPGAEIWVAVVNDETAYTATWQPYVIFPGAANPVQTTAGAGQTRTDVYVIKNIGGAYYARAIQNNY